MAVSYKRLWKLLVDRSDAYSLFLLLQPPNDIVRG